MNKLDKVRRTGENQWVACCPVHDDRSPSLSIRLTADRILLHCFAGCPAEDVLSALNLTFNDLYGDTSKAAYAGATAYQGRKFKPLRPVDPLAHELLIIEIGRADIEAGASLSFEDRARLKLAIERVRNAQDDAA
ncbi:CHC2 zinc finger domain-containing protein [Thiolapillus sp.]